MIEILVDELSSLPKEVVSNLRGLHKKDVASKAFSTELNKEEKELLSTEIYKDGKNKYIR